MNEQAEIIKRKYGLKVAAQLRGEIEAINETLTIAAVDQFARDSGRILAAQIIAELQWETFPEALLFESTARDIIFPLLQVQHQNLTPYFEKAQDAENKRQGWNVKSKMAEFSKSRANGLVETMINQPYESLVSSFPATSEQFSQGMIDDSVRSNADFVYKVGYEVYVTRIAEGKACKWCRGLEGTYDYGSLTNRDDVWRRHEGCICDIQLTRKSGKKETVENYRPRTVRNRERSERIANRG